MGKHIAGNEEKANAKNLKDTALDMLNALTDAATPAEKAIVLEANQRKLIKAVAYILGRPDSG